jgi:hypothetical protein
MCFFKKKSPETLVKTDKERLAELKTQVDIVTHMASDENICARLEKISDVLKYMSPSDNPKAKDVEKRIGDRLDDLKIVLSSKKEADKVEDLLNKVELLVIERRGGE